MVPCFSSRPIRLLIPAVALLLLLPGQGLGQTYVWNGSTSSHWGTASNWDGNQLPVTNADLVFASASIINLPTDNSNPSATLFRSFTFNTNLGAPLTISGQGMGVAAGGIIQNSAHLVTLNFNLQTTASQTWNTSSGGGLTIQQLTVNTTESNFNLGDSSTRASGAFTLTGVAGGDGFVNLNTTSGRTATLWHNITLSGSQRWSSTDAKSRTVVSSNLTAAAGTVLTLADSNGAEPNFSFGGTNSAFLGDITTSTGSGVVILDNPSAMIGGRVLLGGGRMFGLEGATGSSTPPTYTFDYAAGTPPAAPAHGRGVLVFSGTSFGGLYATGTARWDPGAGSDYLTTATEGANTIDLSSPSGSFFFPGYIIRFGTTGTNFVLRSNLQIRGVNSPSPLVFDYALSDDGTARNFWTGAPLTVLTRARSSTNALTSSANLGGTTTLGGGMLSINGANRIFNGNLILYYGTLAFDNMSWADFAAARTPGTGANQYQIIEGGFAARGTPVTITAASTTASTFDRNFNLGSPQTWLPGGNTELYANAGVTIARQTLLSNRRTISIYSEGPGLTGAAGSGFVHAITGGMSDNGASKGAVVLRTMANAFFQDKVSELVLGGTNNWTGSANALVGGWHLNSGPGGLIVPDSTMLVRFADPNALPSGNGGQTAYLAAVRNNGGTFSQLSGLHGFLFTGNSGGQTYTLPAGMRILTGGAGIGGNGLDGIIGSTGGSATLAAAPIYVNMTGLAENLRGVSVLVRDGTFTLGTGTDAAGAVSFVATRSGAAGSDTGIDGAASPLLDRSSGFTAINKAGPGLLVLQNVRYTDIAGTGPFAGGVGGQSLTWNINSGIVRDNAADLANFGPAGIRLLTTIEGRGSMTRALGFTANTLDWSNGGFAAVGGSLTINVGGAATPATLVWGQNRFMSAVSFAPTLKFGSVNATHVVTLANPIDLGSSGRTIEVEDNPTTTADYAVLAGNLTSASTSGSLRKTGSGRLDLQGSNNNYPGRTDVIGGRLNVNGTLSGNAGGITVITAGTLGGTGTIGRPVLIDGGGTLNPGAGAPGTLTINSNLVFAPDSLPATFAARLNGPATADRLVMNGNVNLNSATLSIMLGFAPTAGDRFYLIVNDGTDAISGTFAGLANGASRTFTYNGTDYTGWIYYTGDFGSNALTGGNDAVVSFSPVPEPASVLGVGLAVLGIGRLALRRRFRRDACR